MAGNCLNFANRETERVDLEIEELQGRTRLHNETKNAWDTIVRNATSESQAACLELANSETARLNKEIEAVQEEIHRHIEIKDAWGSIARNTGSESSIHQGVTYMKGEDGQWHLQRLDMEIEELQGRILLHNETKNAWDTIVRNATSESQAACLELANSEIARLNGEIEAGQEEIHRRCESRNAWDTIMRNATSESRIYHGALYTKGRDGQWHLQQTQANESNEESDQRWTGDAVSKGDSVWQALLNTCEKTLLGPQKQVNFPAHGKEEFQSLGLS